MSEKSANFSVGTRKMSATNYKKFKNNKTTPKKEREQTIPKNYIIGFIPN